MTHLTTNDGDNNIIILPLTGDREALIKKGWILQLWGAKIASTDEDEEREWLTSYLANSENSEFDSVKIVFPRGWKIENNKSTDGEDYDPYADWWAVDHMGRRRILVQPQNKRGHAWWHILSRYEIKITTETPWREDGARITLCTGQVIDGGKNVVRKVGPTEQAELSVAYELADYTRSLHPSWNDPVTSWFSPEFNPFRGEFRAHAEMTQLFTHWFFLLKNRSHLLAENCGDITSFAERLNDQSRNLL